MKKCSVEGCPKAFQARGYCSMHYTRLVRRGSLGPVEAEKERRDLSKPCAVEDCGRKQYAKGYCRTHREQILKHGRIVKEKLKRFQAGHTDQEWFDQNIQEAANGCIEWQAGKTTRGYGSMRIRGKIGYAHRFIYGEVHGQVPAGMVIDHKCGNPSCVNVNHLHAVTQKQNNENRPVRKDSSSGIRGVRRIGNKKNPWSARVRHNGKDIYVGVFATADEAEAAVIKARAKYFTNSLTDGGWGDVRTQGQAGRVGDRA